MSKISKKVIQDPDIWSFTVLNISKITKNVIHDHDIWSFAVLNSSTKITYNLRLYSYSFITVTDLQRHLLVVYRVHDSNGARHVDLFARDGAVTFEKELSYSYFQARNLVTVPVTFRQGTSELYLLQLQLPLIRFGLENNLVPVTVPKTWETEGTAFH